MSWPFLATKYLSTAAIVVLVSEVAKHSNRLGALLASLPLVTFMVLIWLHLEHQEPARISAHAWYTFWYVLPTLPMFLAFPWLHQHLGFVGALLVYALATMLCFALLAALLKPLGIDLL